MTRFVALFDLHYGYERKHGHKISLHDDTALSAVLAFCGDFKPQVVILGGDTLDCGAISHHNKHKPGAVEGLRLLSDAKELRQRVLTPLEALQPKRMVYHIGNHERWLEDLTEELPGLEGLITIDQLLSLDRWEIIPQGKVSRLGKLYFAHGDQLSGGEHIAKAGVTTYGQSLRFGHHHTFQVYAKNTPLDNKVGQTGMAVPCLCKKDPNYGRGKANRWVQGFLWGYVDERRGTYNDYVSVIVNGRFTANGRTYGR